MPEADRASQASPSASAAEGYGRKLAAELRHFTQPGGFRDLPPATHYWANKYLAPEVERVFGINGPVRIFAQECEQALSSSGARRLLSLGAGAGETEMALAVRLRELGHEDFVVECLELNPELCEKANQRARRAGLGAHLHFTPADLNRWVPEQEGQYAAIIANQILHHLVELEHILAAVRSALAPRGRLLTRDMMGRNGHRCWPEAREVVDEIWGFLPRRYRWDHTYQRYQERFPDRDHSQHGFEGIRSQDLLPLLVANFHFERFVAFGGIIERFAGRAFGPNYDVRDNENDRLTIDMLYFLNKQLIDSGTIKPTQLIATLCCEAVEPRCGFGWSPRWCLRPTNG